MGDMSEDFKVLSEEKKKRHAKWHEENMAIIGKSDIQYEIKNHGECIVTPLKASFYPSTGRWTFKGKTYSGGAKSFINWYNKMEHNV